MRLLKITSLSIIIIMLLAPVSAAEKSAAIMSNHCNDSYSGNNDINKTDKLKSDNSDNNTNDTDNSNNTNPEMVNGERFNNITFLSNNLTKNIPYVFQNRDSFESDFLQPMKDYPQPKWNPPSCPKPKWIHMIYWWAVILVYTLWYLLQLVIYFFFSIANLIFLIISFCKAPTLFVNMFKYCWQSLFSKIENKETAVAYRVNIYWNETIEGVDLSITRTDNSDISFHKNLQPNDYLVKLINNNILPSDKRYQEDLAKWIEEYRTENGKIPSSKLITEFHKKWDSQFSHEDVNDDDEDTDNNNPDNNSATNITIPPDNIDKKLTIFNTDYTLDINSTKISNCFNDKGLYINSGSNTSYSSLSDDELQKAYEDNLKSQQSSKDGSDILNSLLTGIGNLLSLIDLYQKACLVVAPVISSQTGGASVALSASEGVAAEGVKEITVGAFLKELVNEIILPQITGECVSSLISRSSDTIDGIKNAVNQSKNESTNNITSDIDGEVEHYVSNGVYIGADLMGIYFCQKENMESFIKFISDKVKGIKTESKPLFDIVKKVFTAFKLAIKLITSIGQYISNDKFDMVSAQLKNEMEYRHLFHRSVVL